ncbi:MAG TPA: DNA helicase PriA [Acetivibrio sp.]|nr:DNA helicase PriA [Acetivibrio sp.]
MSSVKEYKCPSCGASLQFDPPTQSWKCHYCSTEYSKDQFDKQSQEELPDEDMPELDSYICNSCGAELIADETTSATFCLYCKSAAIIKSRFSGRFKPKSVIPFKLTKEQSKQIYSKWIHKRILAPKEFKQKEEIDKVTGIYAPFWLFNCRSNGFIQGEARTVHSWRSGNYRYTQTKYYNFLRRGNSSYNNIPVDASKKLDDKFMQMIEPYDYNEIQNFSMKYMSGFMAERYDVEAAQAETVMRNRVEDYFEKRLRSTVTSYSSYTVNSKQVVLSDIENSYSMLPVYLLINKYRDKDHIFIINGQTGKVVGDTPISPFRQIVFGVVVFLIVWIIAVFGGALFV